jgi:type III restriction enzyme
MTRVVQHVWEAIRQENTQKLVPVFDSEHPICSTGDMRPWYTGRPNESIQRSHVNRSVYDSTWEACEAFVLEHDPHVEAWVKNDHLGFEILYVFNGAVRKYRPDFLVRLTNGKMLIVEVKGEDSQQNDTKRHFLDEWCRAVNEHGTFGTWAWAVSRHPGDIKDILVRHGQKVAV